MVALALVINIDVSIIEIVSKAAKGLVKVKMVVVIMVYGFR